MDQKQQQSTKESQPMMVPIWAIVIIVIIIIIVLIAVAIYFIRRRRNRSLSVHTIHRKENDDSILNNKEVKKTSTSSGSLQTLVNQQKKQNSFTNTTTPPVPNNNFNTQRQLEENTPHINNNNNNNNNNNSNHSINEKTDKPASLFDESEYNYSPPDPPQEIKISLPLPPPSTSFFSDKMELDGNEQDLYDMYLSTKNKNTTGFTSIDLDNTTSATSGPSFYSNAASNIQQKAATIRSSFIQSLRLQSKSNRTSAQQVFPTTTTTVTTTTKEDTPKKSGVLYGNQSTIARKSSEINKNSSTITTDSNKTIIDMRGAMPEYNSNLPIPKQPLDKLDVTQNKNTTNILVDNDSPITPNPNLQEPVRAAKRVLRSASRKTKSRSMIVTDNDDFNFLNNQSTEDDVQLLSKIEKDGRKPKHGSIRFASIRGPKSTGEHMTITSGSMRRLVRESILFDDDSLPSMPVASSAAMASTKNSNSRKSGGISAVDIAGWWEGGNDNTTTPKNLNSATVTVESSNTNTSLPLFQNITAGSNSSGTPNQYRASLSTSIFGTLSKSSGALFSESNKEDNNAANGGVSRHNSFRRGTLNRNTLRNITANATNGVNRSLKGLFDHSSSSVNKIVPDDSQKTELDSEPIQMAIEEKAVIDPQQQEQQKQQYKAVRQKSLRSSSNDRPNLSSGYLPTSESSTKYALSDEASLPDEFLLTTENSSTSQPKSSKINTSSSTEINKHQVQKELPNENSTKTKDAANTTNGEVDVIRRMLQDTWINNMRESGSMFSISSDTDSIVTTSTQQSNITNNSNNSSKLNPRQQNQALLSKSLLTQQVAKRASLLARTGISSEDVGFVPQQGPEPSASFSSSTVRTMVPEGSNNNNSNSNNASEPINIRQNAITSNNGSNKIQESSYDEKNSHLSSSALISRFSTSPMDTSVSSPRNSSADSSRGHSRKSSGGNSAATALRISSGYSANAKTWNGRAQKKSSRPSVTQLINDDDTTPSTPDSAHLVSPSEQQHYQSLGRSSVNKRAFFSTMRKGQKSRGGIPWMMEEDEEERTPAQIERDKYLGKP